MISRLIVVHQVAVEIEEDAGTTREEAGSGDLIAADIPSEDVDHAEAAARQRRLQLQAKSRDGAQLAAFFFSQPNRPLRIRTDFVPLRG
jgi:hypothetical protein